MGEPNSKGTNSKESNSEESSPVYCADDEIELLVKRFEALTLLPSELPHRAHMALSVWYLMRLPQQEAIGCIYDGLLRFVKHHNLKVYNETTTLFWIKLIRRFVEEADKSRSIKDVANDLIARFGDSRVIFGYYSKERLQSEEARERWVEPDLKPLDF